MTGYGRGEAPLGVGAVVCELQSVNHRFLDLRIRSPFGNGLQEQVTKLIRQALQRGAVTCHLSVVETETESNGDWDVNLPMVGAMVTRLREVGEAVGITSPIQWKDILSQPGVVVAKSKFGSKDAISIADATDSATVDAIKEAVESALSSLVAMREVEGNLLKQELSNRSTNVASLVERMDIAAKAQIEHIRKSMQKRIAVLMASIDGDVDENRLLQEVALLVDKSEVTEEIVRLRSHMEQFRSTCTSDGAVGKRQNFLLQEMTREVNTIGAKSQFAALSQLVVMAKVEIEKLREQVQNVE